VKYMKDTTPIAISVTLSGGLLGRICDCRLLKKDSVRTYSKGPHYCLPQRRSSVLTFLMLQEIFRTLSIGSLPYSLQSTIENNSSKSSNTANNFLVSCSPLHF
jgi:hypothetical protein